MSCVDDILACGLQDPTDWFLGEFSPLILLEYLGELRPPGKIIPCWGRRLLRATRSGFISNRPNRM